MTAARFRRGANGFDAQACRNVFERGENRGRISRQRFPRSVFFVYSVAAHRFPRSIFFVYSVAARGVHYNSLMRAVRYLYVLALALWLGGMALAGLIVAPTVFSVLGNWDAATGRVLAGNVFGEILRRLYLVGAAAGTLMLAALTLQRVIGPRPKAYGVRAALIVVMVGLTVYAAARLQPRIETLQAQAGGPMIQLADGDPRRAEFDRLHSLSTTLMSLTMLGGLALLVWESRE